MSNTSIGRATDEVPATEIRYSIDEVAQLVIGFEAQWSRPPNQDEFNALVEDRVRRDVLYREALALGLDKDDEIVKRRMAPRHANPLRRNSKLGLPRTPSFSPCLRV